LACYCTLGQLTVVTRGSTTLIHVRHARPYVSRTVFPSNNVFIREDPRSFLFHLTRLWLNLGDNQPDASGYTTLSWLPEGHPHPHPIACGSPNGTRVRSSDRRTDPSGAQPSAIYSTYRFRSSDPVAHSLSLRNSERFKPFGWIEHIPIMGSRKRSSRKGRSCPNVNQHDSN
jgi:hypothetical protein